MDYNYLMLLNKRCTSDYCNILDENDEIGRMNYRLREYCSENDNLVTEDICHNLYTNYVYSSNSSHTAEWLGKKLYEVCEKYPMHIRCKCANFKRTFDYDDNNILSTFGYSCTYPKCSNKTANRDPNNSNSSLIPYDIYNETYSCPQNICQIIMKDNDFDLKNSEISIANNCNNQETEVKKEEEKEEKKEVSTNNNSKKGDEEENNNNSIIIIAIISIIIVFLILIILLAFIKIIRRRRRYYP